MNAIGPLERGTALHKALELFVAEYPDGLPEDAVQQLVAIADQVFDEAGTPTAALALWRPRFLGAAQWFVALERERAQASCNRIWKYAAQAQDPADFTLTGVADRIDILRDGAAAILDYKTGTPPRKAGDGTAVAAIASGSRDAGQGRLRHRRTHCRRTALSAARRRETGARCPAK